MKKILLLIVVIIIATNSFAQMPQGMPGGSKNVGHIYGKLTDPDGKPISGASVILMQQKTDSATKKFKMILVKAKITDNNGDFDFDQVPVATKRRNRLRRGCS